MQLIGIPLALVMGLFFWVGSQTFVNPTERLFANVMLVYCIILLGTSIGSLIVPALRTLNMVLTLGAIAIFATGLIYSRIH